MCTDIKLKTQDEQFAYFVDLAKANTVEEYGSYYLKNETFAYQVNFVVNIEWSRLKIMVVSKLHRVRILANCIWHSSSEILKTQS